jgi:hypothetical protein
VSSSRLPIGAEEMMASEPQHLDERFASRQRRRLAAARVRRRRLMVIDLAIGAALALFGLIVAPGLAILALAGLIALAACGLWAGAERLLARREQPLRLRRRRGIAAAEAVRGELDPGAGRR